jgi:hypothetical protein
MNADKDLIVIGNWLLDVPDFHDVRRSVSAINGSFHAALACSFLFLLADRPLFDAAGYFPSQNNVF